MLMVTVAPENVNADLGSNSSRFTGSVNVTITRGIASTTGDIEAPYPDVL
jgi:hypothetical protein